ncbi:MAG: VWA domain-containing protein [Burkholderiales bacterium]|nr:VWA domain-containing protein [Burkholderiales bacterium]
MSFQWPVMLWLLLIVPVFAVLYARLQARWKRAAVRYASLEMVQAGGAGKVGSLQRHVPPVLMLAGLCALVAAMARPHADVMLPSRMETIMLAIDASGSMRAADVKPSRIAAARDAAKAFIAEQPGHVRVGVISIAGTAALVQSPTRNREDILKAIDRLQLQGGTALGSGLVIALATLLPEAGIEVGRILSDSRSPTADLWWVPGAPAFKPVPPGSYGSGAIVLLSDGQSNVGPDPIEMAKMAAERGVRIFTVGLGTFEGAVLSVDGWSMRVRLDEEVLKKIATTTYGEYFRAANASELSRIYKTLSVRLAIEKQRLVEVTAVFAGIGALLAMLSALLSMLWFNRIL